MNLPASVWEAVIGAIGVVIGGLLVFIVSFRKSKPEMEKLESEAAKARAEEAESWARSGSMAIEQLRSVQSELLEERKARLELAAQFEELKIELSQVAGRVRRLEAQVVSLGADPVK